MTFSLRDAMLASMLDDDDGPAVSDDGKVERLREMQSRYAHFMKHGCPFKPGDLVTPRSSSGLKNVGAPHIVLEVRESHAPHWTDEPGMQSFGCRHDMRVGSIMRDEDTAHWVESFAFDGWS